MNQINNPDTFSNAAAATTEHVWEDEEQNENCSFENTILLFNEIFAIFIVSKES